MDGNYQLLKVGELPGGQPQPTIEVYALADEVGKSVLVRLVNLGTWRITIEQARDFAKALVDKADEIERFALPETTDAG